MKKKSYIDDSLTFANCSKRGYYWIHDILFYDNPYYGTFVIFEESFNKGYKLGQPKKTDEEKKGFYAPKDIVAERLSNIFNPTLTPANAKESGYQYVDDIVYNILTPNRDILELIANHGYKLGIAKEDENTHYYFGLFMPQKMK